MTLDEHIKRLAKHSVDSPEEIKTCIEKNSILQNEDSLMSFCYNYDDVHGKTMMVMFASGDGKTIWDWIHYAARNGDCSKVYCITQRPKALERKWHFKPIGTVMELEVS